MKNNTLKKTLDKLFGGLPMSWSAVLLYAVGAAVLTAVFLVVPVFKDTSFYRMGVYLEAWILFAVLIMANCKKPLESAAKVFVFFLISQPLIYLLQVPFSWQGWNLFHYYGRWFVLTLLTFPAAFAGWYINKRSWVSVLILAPVLAFLGSVVYSNLSEAISNFPHLLLTALFCLLQIAVYVFAFFPKTTQKLVGLGIPAATILVLLAL